MKHALRAFFVAALLYGQAAAFGHIHDDPVRDGRAHDSQAHGGQVHGGLVYGGHLYGGGHDSHVHNDHVFNSGYDTDRERKDAPRETCGICLVATQTDEVDIPLPELSGEGPTSLRGWLFCDGRAPPEKNEASTTAFDMAATGHGPLPISGLKPDTARAPPA